ncbi:PREDICTED: thionin-like protein 1 [Camelina sativa]|uniref:Thionin-like protein 1 n=1 Tax=Camelina sativa TaxID=90675 RepID=A0ABM1R5H5_CAMSA|nr:PREDICTED: thionin-like protein 1 [Camelina sativa]
MEDKRMAMLVVMMLVMGNMLIETEAVLSFPVCYAGCLAGCGVLSFGFKKLLCPIMCIKDCKRRTLSVKAKSKTDYYCNLGCATDRCASSSSIDDKDHVQKVSVCVDSCSETCSTCSHKN